MQTIDLTLPYTEVALVLAALRHYIKYVDDLDEDSINEDILADLLNDSENIKAIEKNIAIKLSEALS